MADRDLKRFITLREAARTLGIGARTLERAVRSGELPSYHFGTGWRHIRGSDQDKWIERRRSR